MSETVPIPCDAFEAHAEELALGHVDEPLRGRLLAHADQCAECRALLDGLGEVADRLLPLAPRVEPPAGFESRVLTRFDGDTASSRRRRGAALMVAAAVAIVVAAGLAATRTDEEPKSPTAAIVTAGGTEIGLAELVDEPTPHVLVTIEAPRSAPGTRTCELQRPDGSWATVGWWDAADIESGVWAVGIDPSLLDSTTMRITADGDVLATATFD